MLVLHNTQVTDVGLVYLGGLTRLEQLFLGETHVTDAGLVHLKGLTKLGHLGLSNTQVTDAGIRAFRAALPNAEIRGP